jgi:hypothetical protein
MIRAENISNNSIAEEILKHLTVLPINLQNQVLEFIVKLNYSDLDDISVHQLTRYAGMISSDELDIMTHAIENDCGRIDINCA